MMYDWTTKKLGEYGKVATDGFREGFANSVPDQKVPDKEMSEDEIREVLSSLLKNYMKGGQHGNL